jgi:hypothetical protein
VLLDAPSHLALSSQSYHLHIPTLTTPHPNLRQSHLVH